MKKCSTINYFFGISWQWELSPRLTSWKKSFQELLADRDDCFLWATRATADESKSYWRAVIDNINEELNQIRINETSLRPAVFVKSSYTAP